MQFTRRLRDPIRAGEVTCSVRVWKQPRVKVGGRYALPPGYVVVDALREIGPGDLTPALARRSGFASVEDLMDVARHGSGERIFLVELHYEEWDEDAWGRERDGAPDGDAPDAEAPRARRASRTGAARARPRRRR